MKKQQKYNQDVVKYLKEKFGVSTRYIRSSLDPANAAPFAQTVRAEYEAKVNEINKLLSHNTESSEG